MFFVDALTLRSVRAQKSCINLVNSSLYRSVLPRVAAKLDVSPISEIIGIKDKDTFVRYKVIFNRTTFCN